MECSLVGSGCSGRGRRTRGRPERLDQDRLEHIGAARNVDAKDGEVRGPETPRPELFAIVLVSGLIRPDVRFLDQGFAKLGIRPGEGRTSRWT